MEISFTRMNIVGQIRKSVRKLTHRVSLLTSKQEPFKTLVYLNLSLATFSASPLLSQFLQLSSIWVLFLDFDLSICKGKKLVSLSVSVAFWVWQEPGWLLFMETGR